MIRTALDTVRRIAERLEGDERRAVETVLAYVETPPSLHTASAYRDDETVRVQADYAVRWAEISRQHRDLMLPSVEYLLEHGTVESVEDWCDTHGPIFNHNLRGSDREYIWRRLLKAGERVGVCSETLKAWMR